MRLGDRHVPRPERGPCRRRVARPAPPWRLPNAVVAYVRYLSHVVWPADLVVLYPYPARPHSLAATALALLLLAAITAVAVRVRDRGPALLTGWLWFS